MAERRKTKEKDLDLGRLCVAINRSRLALARQRQVRVDMVRDYAGPYWGAEWEALGSLRKSQPINVLALYVTVVGRSIISKNPKVLLSTFNKQHKPVVSAMQSWCNRELERSGFETTLKRAVLDAFWSLGVIKVALATPGDAAASSWKLKAGHPFAQRVDFDDFAFDIKCRDLREAYWIAHRFRVPLDAAQAFYGKKANLEADIEPLYNLEGDERINVMGKGTYGDTEDYDDFVTLWEVYDRRHKVIVTLNDAYLGGAESQQAGDYRAKALKVQRWLGPDEGPYHFLGFGTVPGNAMPVGPLQNIWDLHDATNRIFRKLIRQAERQKEITFYQSNPEDAERVKNAADGDFCKVENPQMIQKVEFGAPNQQNWVLGNDLFRYASLLAGNLETAGGLAPQAKTAHQEAQLDRNSSGMLSDLAQTANNYTSKVLEAMCWYWHHHPSQMMTSEFALPGLPNISITRRVQPQQRFAIPFEDMDIKVDPYSMTHKTPDQRLATLNQIVTQILIPMAQIAQSQGVAFNMKAYLQKVAELTDEPFVNEIVQMSEPPQESGGIGSGEGAPPAPGGERRTIRENVPMRTQQGDRMNLQNALMGVDQGGASNGKPKMGVM